MVKRNDNNTGNNKDSKIDRSIDKNAGVDKGSNDPGKKKSLKANYREFMDKYGFYVVLFMCICIIGTTALLTSDRNMPWDKALDSTENSQQKQVEGESDDIYIRIIDKTDVDSKDDDNDGRDSDIKSGSDDNSSDTGSSTGSDSGGSNNDPDSKSNSDNDNNSGEDSAVAVDSGGIKKELNMPLEGDIVKFHSLDKLVFSNTLKEWTVHTGIDIKGEPGSEVKAAADGIVDSVVEDTLMGIIITLDHGDGLKTVYSGVSTKGMVTIGQEVKQGQVISGVGNTAVMEVSDDPHLHFEVLLNDEPVDPLKHLNIKDK